MKRRSVALAMLGALLACQSAIGQQLTPIKVGISDTVNTVLPVWMAQEGGFYAANGLKVEIINMHGGSRGAKELQAGHIDLMRVGMSSVVQVNRAAGDLRLIASMSNVIRFVIVSAPGVKTGADLKGGVVGVSSFGSESDSSITLALERFGLTRADVTVKQYGGGSKRLAAVRSGEIKATAINEPTTSRARAEGVHVLLDLAAEKIPWLFSGVVVRRADLRQRRDLLTRLPQGRDRGQLPGARRRGARKEGAGAGGKNQKCENPRHQLCGFQGAVAAEHGHLAAGRHQCAEAQCRQPAAITRPTTSMAACSQTSRRRTSFAALEKKYGKR